VRSTGARAAAADHGRAPAAALQLIQPRGAARGGHRSLSRVLPCAVRAVRAFVSWVGSACQLRLPLLPLLPRMSKEQPLGAYSTQPMLSFITDGVGVVIQCLPVTVCTVGAAGLGGWARRVPGRYRLFVAGQAEREMPPGTEWRNDTHFFDDEGLTASVPSPAIAHFLREFFFRTQLFDVFITDRLAQAAQGYPPKGVFEREVAELLGNIEMFGDDAPGPFSSGALPSSQAFRRAFRGGGRGGSGAGGSDRRWTAAAAAPTADHADGMPQPTSAVAQIVRGGLNSLAKKLW
jgi:hypothetical protein